MSSNGKKPMLKPAIVIGLGGTGNQVVRRLKQMVYNQYGNTPTLLNFLVADTDEDTFNNQSWAPFPALTELEQVPLYDPQVPFSDVCDNPGAYPEIHDWLLPAVDVGLLDRQDGAGQIRMLGRVAFHKSFAFFERRISHFFDQCQRIQNRLDAMQRYDFNVETDPVVYLVSSVCGGQGAGSFIDAAVALRALAISRFPRLNLIGVLTMPSVYAEIVPRENWSKVCANAHAAMKEMDYLMHSLDKSKMQFRFPAPIGRTITPQASLFDVCYLVDNRHQRGALGNEKEVYDQIAAQLFLEIGTPFGARSDSIRVNLNTVAGIEVDRVYHTGRRYSGFGNHSISFDREKIVALASLKSTYLTAHDRLLGKGLALDETEGAVTELMSRHRLDESQTGDLTGALITSREVSQELATNAYSVERPDHQRFAADLWARFDAFWLRRAPELRMQMERRSRAKLDGADGQRGLIADLEDVVDRCVRQSGVAGALDLAAALLARLRDCEALMREGQEQQRAQARRFFQEAEGARTALENIGQQLGQLRGAGEGATLLSRLWRMLGSLATFGLWRPGAADEENRARQFQELSLRAQDQRNRFLSSANSAVEHRLAEEARDIAASLYTETITRLADSRDRLEPIQTHLEESSRRLLGELNQLLAEVNNSTFISGNTMRRDVTADYVDQYHEMHFRAAADEVLKWLMPEAEGALAALESRSVCVRLRQKFYDRYAEDILRRKDRDGLAEMINRFNGDHAGGSLTDRIGEGLRFCLPFWDIRVPGNQFTTEVLLVGLARHHPAVETYLDAHAAAQRGEVLPQVVPTGQDSVILISRVAHGAAYYWHAQDETYFREYTQALETSPYPVHLRKEWRGLPEPIPDPSKYERRVFALGIACEFIAIRGAAYYLDPRRRYSLAGTARQDTPDWKTIPLMEAISLSDPPRPAAAPATEDRLDDENRTEAMQKFIEVDRQVAAVREKLTELFNQQGRDRMRRQIERYCRDVLAPAVEELGEDDKARHQLEIELAAMEEVIAELRPATGRLKLVR
jgi:tubulin-like protein